MVSSTAQWLRDVAADRDVSVPISIGEAHEIADELEYLELKCERLKKAVNDISGVPNVNGWGLETARGLSRQALIDIEKPLNELRKFKNRLATAADRASMLRELADHVERYTWSSVHDFAYKAQYALVGSEDVRDFTEESSFWHDNVIKALRNKSVDAAQCLIKEGVIYRVDVDEEGYTGMLAIINGRELSAEAQNEAHARLALAFRIRAEQEENSRGNC